MKIKLYTSKSFLYKRYVVDKKTAKQISEECGTSEQTITNWLTKFELIKNPRKMRRG